MLQINKTLSFLSMWLLIVLLLIVVFVTIPFGNFQRTNILVFITFTINGFLWIFLLIKEVNKYPFSLMMMHWSFCLLFFFFAAIVQYSNNIFPWVDYLSDESLIKTNLYLTSWTCFIFLGSTIVRIRQNEIETDKFKLYPLRFKNKKINQLTISLIIMSVLIMIYRLKEVGFINLLSWGTSGLTYSENSAISLFLSKTLQAISYFSVIFSFVNKQINKKGNFLFFGSVMVLLISYFPFALSRNATAVIWLGLLLTISKYLKRSKIFIILFISAFLIIFPFLNAFRNTSFYDVSIIQSISNVFENLSRIWLAGDYDAYTILNLFLDFISTNGITFGYQLLGVFLFFIPRAFWVSKPIGSGAFIATNSNWKFTNISCPLPAEGLINFGFIGLIVFGVLIGFIAKKLDLLYWKNIDTTGNSINRFELIYPVLLMFFFFMCRGDLLSSTAYMMSFVFTWFILTKFLDIKIKK